MSAESEPAIDDALPHADAALSGIQAIEYVAACRAAALLPGRWDVRLEQDYHREAFIVLLPETDVALPGFLLSRDGAFIRLVSCTGDEHGFEGAYPSVELAMAGASRLVKAG